MEHGGRREGSGRKTTGHVSLCVRLSPEQAKKFRDLGGSRWLASVLDKE